MVRAVDEVGRVAVVGAADEAVDLYVCIHVMCACIYVCVCMHIYIYIYMYVQVQTDAK